MSKQTSALTKASEETAKRITKILEELKKKSDKELPFGYTDQKKP